MRPCSEFAIPGEPDPSKEVAAEILRRHRYQAKEPWLSRLLGSILTKLSQALPRKSEPPQWPLAGVRQPLGRGPRPQSGAVAMKEPW
jgi:hypothetical protein